MCESEVYNNNPERVEFDRSWADLPRELLSDIFSRVFLDKHPVVFSLVCKSWDSALHESPTPDNHLSQLLNDATPHLFFTSNKLINPILDKVYKLNKFPKRTLGVQLCTSKEDWLLFYQNSLCRKPSKAFFFNPFTKSMIWLPDLPGNPNSMWFTSPTSPAVAEWKVVAIRNYDSCCIAIDTIKCNEESWTSCEFKFRDNSCFEFSSCNPVLYKGMCYVFGKDSMLLIHNPKKKTFFLHKAPEYIRWSGGEQYMLESNGKLLAVFVRTGGGCVLVCRWSLSMRQWEKLDSLGNTSLFVSRPYSISETVSTRGNRIYFPRLVDDRCLFYSLDTKRFHTSNGSSFTSFHGTKSAFSSTWIKSSYVCGND